MPQPTKIPRAFADSGDKNSIPESSGDIGFASWQEGFPAICSQPFSEGGVAPKRADFNGIFNALSQAIMWMQQGGMYAYDAGTDYEAGNVVLDAGGLYVANAANGPSSAVVQPSTDTAGATWKRVRLDLATQSAAGYMSANDKQILDLENTVQNLSSNFVLNSQDLSISIANSHIYRIGNVLQFQVALTIGAVPSEGWYNLGWLPIDSVFQRYNVETYFPAIILNSKQALYGRTCSLISETNRIVLRSYLYSDDQFNRFWIDTTPILR